MTDLSRVREKVPLSSVTATTVQRRGDLEPFIESRISGLGTNYGWRLHNRRRVGPMLRGGAVGPEFWAVGRGSTDQELIIRSHEGHDYARLVLGVDAETRGALSQPSR
ncbi:MAG TPA: hypothetical protein VLB85_03460 [Acidimicrobiia bacterium]|nr:hypothetical protein [Acidimicrobiia bacterium]